MSCQFTGLAPVLDQVSNRLGAQIMEGEALVSSRFPRLLQTLPHGLEPIARVRLAQADEPANAPFKTFKTLGEAVSFYKDKGQIPHGTGNVYTGYSLEPFGSRTKALAEAEEKAQKAGISAGLITQDAQRTYNTPPPGTKWYGTYDVVSLGAITPVEATPENLLAEIQRNPEGAYYLQELAKQPTYKGLTKAYRDIIRTRNEENARGIDALVRLVAFHDGKVAGDDLIKWAKYHKNADVRMASDLALIEFGRAAEVEEILKTEQNREVKEKIQKSLI